MTDLINAATALVSLLDEHLDMNDYMGLEVGKRNAHAVNDGIEALRAAILQAATPTQNNMKKWIIDEPTLLHIMSVAIGAAYVSVEDASKRLGVTAPIMQAATRDAPSADAFAEYRRGVREAFNHANVIRANPHGRNADETLTYIMRTLAELASGDSAPKGDGNE